VTAALADLDVVTMTTTDSSSVSPAGQQHH